MNVGVAATVKEHGMEPGRAASATTAAAESREREGKLRVCEKKVGLENLKVACARLQ